MLVDAHGRSLRRALEELQEDEADAPWTPSSLAIMSSGLWWDPDAYTGTVLPEMQGITAADMTKTGTVNTGTVGVGAHTYLEFPATSGFLASPSNTGLSTTKEFNAGWIQFPSGVVGAGLNVVLPSQYPTSRVLIYTSAATEWRGLYNNGSADFIWQFPATFDSGWHWVYSWIDTTDATPTQRLKLWVDDVQQTPSSAASGGTSMNIASIPYRVARWSSNNVNTTRCRTMFKLPVFPSAAELQLMKKYNPPIAA